MPDNVVNRQAHRRGRSRPSQTKYSKSRVRWILVNWTMLIVVLTLIAYCYTKDIRVLYLGTVVDIAMTAVFTFYFKSPRRRG